jgi:hypothetical protein
MTTLEQEQFDTLKALAEVHASLSEAQAELFNVRKTTDEYMVVREQEAEKRVLKILKESRDALEETSKNHKELSGYSRDLKAYAGELKVLSTDIVALFKDFNVRMKEAEKIMDERRKEADLVLKEAKSERIQITEDRKMLERERKQTADGFRLLKDRNSMLERAFEELRRLKNKK